MRILFVFIFWMSSTVSFNKCLAAEVPIEKNGADSQGISILFVGTEQISKNELIGVLKVFFQTRNGGNYVCDISVFSFGRTPLYKLVMLGIPTSKATLGFIGNSFIILQEDAEAVLLKPDILTPALFHFSGENVRNKCKIITIDSILPKILSARQVVVNTACEKVSREFAFHHLPLGAAWTKFGNEHPDVPLFDADGYSPSLAGTYLQACLIYEAVSKNTSIGLPYEFEVPRTPRNVQFALPQAVAQQLQLSAHESLLR